MTGAIAVVNDGTVMRRSKRRERAEATVTRLQPLSTWLVILAGVVIVALTGPVTLWLYGIAGHDPARQIEAIKTGLTMAAGIGGAFALLLAFRRQSSTEIIATETQEARDREYEQRDRAADASERDAEQRRITELYTKAADQLGSEKAPVRLAGLHALERLAQKTPDQRQTIVDVICAYLRMPYTPPDEQSPAEDAPAEVRTRYENRSQELQVRLTAQRILGAHLIPEEADGFWSNIGIDLTEAHLYRFSFFACHVRMAHFDGAQFTGFAQFAGAQFDGPAYFGGARFGGDAAFDGAQFKGLAGFGEARFSQEAHFFMARLGSGEFRGAQFGGAAGFNEASFDGDADFDEAQFDNAAAFRGAQFGGVASFLRAQFEVEADFCRALFRGRHARFGGARFGGAQSGICAGFGETQFSGDAGFGGARFGGDAHFQEARFGVGAHFHDALFDGDARFDGARFSGNTLFINAKFSEGAVFCGAQFGGYANFNAVFNAAADFIEARFGESGDFEGARARPRRHSWPAEWTTRDARTAKGDEEGWVYLVRVKDGGEQQPDREDRSDGEAGTSGT